MDLTQRKLSKEEWMSIEEPVSADEKQILNMILSGYSDVQIRTNQHVSMLSFVKIENTDEMAYFLYSKYFADTVQSLVSKYGKSGEISAYSMGGSALKTLKSADSIRIQNLENNIKQNRGQIFEYLLIDLATELLKLFSKQKPGYAFYLYTLIQLKKSTIRNLNIHVVYFVDSVIQYANRTTLPSHIIENAYEFIERNQYLLKYEDKALFAHQKQLFSLFKRADLDEGLDESDSPHPKLVESDSPHPKLVLYTAPTGTGKTMSPIGLAVQYRVIFVCVARHIGLALAKSAISVEKKVAFAFGCETASDIRLHYFSAVNYTKNKKSGGIGKVDNSVGTDVEIMICDVQSYRTAMYYMLAFNEPDNIITYWDEPTITMDYEQHDLHPIIQQNWAENKIPNLVLSCATLPQEREVQSVIDDFREKFDGAEIHTITSFDCKKSIPILNKDGLCVLPHTLYENYDELSACVAFCEENKTMLRYFDLREIIRFVTYCQRAEFIDPAYTIDSYFAAGIQDIHMNRLKEYYLNMLKHIRKEKWPVVYQYMLQSRVPKYKPSLVKTKSVDSVAMPAMASRATNSVASRSTASGGILITTSDAYTLTDGPTIFLADDVQKIGTFYIQQSNISNTVFQHILTKIALNDEIQDDIDKLESLVLEKQGADEEGKGERERLSKESKDWMDQINRLRKTIRTVSLDPIYVPNTKPHQQIWTPNGEVHENAFMSNIDEYTAKKIMVLKIDNQLKVLLLLGIGLFTNNPNIQYMEVMKKLADEQRLFIIIASSDYIYGTNYQFCHGFIGKDLTNMTQQKTLQAMGRIGRNNIQQDYTVRFRDDAMILKLFSRPEINREAVNMCRLFGSEPVV